MMGHPVEKDILWADNICNTSMYIRGHTPSIWESSSRHDCLRRISSAAVWAYLERVLLYLSVAVAMNQVGRGSQQWHIILRDNSVPIDCFHYKALFPCWDPFHTPMTLFHNAITGGDVRTTEMQSDSPFA